MNTLDSRTLRLGDCFGQRFPTAGSVRYFVTAGGIFPGAETRSDGGYLINVKPAPKGGAPNQHNVVVSRKDNALVVTPAELEIQVGDGVLWHTTDASLAGFQVSGAGQDSKSKDFRFDSARIQQDALYTHVFGVPGMYEWTDPNGSGAAGSVEVESATPRNDEERDRWYEMLKKPAGFEIQGKVTKPRKLKITVGQTVFWSIQKSTGMAITDVRFVPTPPAGKA
jgi:plastocyanin